MKLWLSLCILLGLTGCSVKDRAYTIILEEEVVHVKNLKGEECIISGYNARNDQLTTSYLNCEVTIIRNLKEREKSQWLQPPKPKKKSFL